MKRAFVLCIIALGLSFPVEAKIMPASDDKIGCLVEAYDAYINAQQKAATDSAALSAKYIPESAKMAETQKSVRLLETDAEKFAFNYLAATNHTAVPLDKPISQWMQIFDLTARQKLSADNKQYVETLEKLAAAKTANDAAKAEWKSTDAVKTPADLLDYQNALLDVARELTEKTRDAETHCVR